MFKWSPVSIVVLVLTTGANGSDTPRIALKGLDPVELTAGKEMAGDPQMVLRHGKFHYAFASEANRKTFAMDPARYAIQFDGACMRMGPLSGGGSQDRFYVFDGRIYVFASEGCLNAFKINPRLYIDQDDDAPQGSPDSIAKAETILRKAVAAMGGEKALKDLATYQVTYKITTKQGDREYQQKRLTATAFPATYVQLDDYGTAQYRWLTLADGGYFSPDKGRTAAPEVQRYMMREYYREPVHILKAWLNGESKVSHMGEEKVADQPVERVAIGIQGATTTLSIDSNTGRIIRTNYRGRTQTWIKDIENVYSDFRRVNGLDVPFKITTRHGGKPVTNPTLVIESIQVNARIDPAILKKPE